MWPSSTLLSGPTGDLLAAAGSQKALQAGALVALRCEGVPLGQGTALLEGVWLRSAGA